MAEPGARTLFLRHVIFFPRHSESIGSAEGGESSAKRIRRPKVFEMKGLERGK
jgi:hypothetical protein